jgi:CheY-like chemotaxis protein
MSDRMGSRSVPMPGTGLPASPKFSFQPPPAGDFTKAFDGLPVDDEVSRILVVDDDPGILKLVAKMAEHLGYRPATAVDAMDALYCLNKTHYDVGITDFEMPLMDGFQLADQIKKKYFDTKVIIMTGHCERAIEDMMEDSDVVDGLLLKPFNLTAMREKIERVGVSPSAKWTI